MSLEDRVDRLGRDLRRPVVLYDQAMKLVAHSAHSEQEIDPNRRGAILARRTEPRALQLVHRSGVHRSPGPVLVPSDPGHADRIGMAVRHEGVVLGYLVCNVEDGDVPFDERFDDLLRTAAAEIALLLQIRVLERRTRQHSSLAAVRDLLADDEATREHAAATLHAEGFGAAARGYLALALSTRLPLDDPPPQADRLRLETILGDVAATSAAGSAGAVGAVVADTAVLVCAVAADHERALTRLGRSLPAGVRVGVGTSRERLADVAASAREAALALAGCWRDPGRYGTVATWADLGADRLLLRLPLTDLGAADLPDAVRRLLDAPGGPDLAHTVEAYLHRGGDAQATAQALSIHRSTLYYRLDRVRTLTGVDVRHGAARHDLQVGLRVATLCGLR
ncbi:helix-turn-helix domain-containing protein [Nocardioides sp. zg-536]|uniref:Helix-turn-helix domain-containing protein n=1 Tax=Nocardioides faecalis TaxID=2803858 RepID=A0A938YBA2_9ACTN|nr:helix-turn-helix domain-containing protein [Nocardioides faecalis]MBM9461205.1 helix-turn-helix domain-containing protein [Nocardioides faecalis]QVI59053.1 helix-turn-helix domain-containing protein [Nocardioides faecalis]